MSFKEFLQAPFVVNESAKAKAKITRDAAKWFLDFLRNVIVVSFLFVVALVFVIVTALLVSFVGLVSAGLQLSIREIAGIQSR